MFERFSDRARRVVVLAQEESRALGNNFIDSDHILLGLLSEGEGIAAQALTTLGAQQESCREAVAAKFPSEGISSGHIPFTVRAKKSLEFSLREALQLGHLWIGTEHVLLGLIRSEAEYPLMASLGLDAAVVRSQVIELLRTAAPPLSSVPPQPAAVAIAAHLRNDARFGAVNTDVVVARVLQAIADCGYVLARPAEARAS